METPSNRPQGPLPSTPLIRVIPSAELATAGTGVLEELEALQRAGWTIGDLRRQAGDPGGLRIELRRSAARSVEVDAGARPLRVLCLHGVNHEEGRAKSEGPWEAAIREGLGGFGAPEPEIRWVPYNRVFAEAGLEAADVLEAAGRLGVSAIWHGVGDLLGVRGFRGERDLGDTLRWTAGMVAQWVENDALRARLRRGLGRLLADPKERPDLLLAHSLGSLIAYDLLARPANAALTSGLTLVTFGSQIGHPSVRAVFGGRLVPIRGLRAWFHLYNSEDHAFTAPLDVRFPAAEPNPNFRQCAVPFDRPDDLLNHDAGEYLKQPGTVTSVWHYAAVELAGVGRSAGSAAAAVIGGTPGRGWGVVGGGWPGGVAAVTNGPGMPSGALRRRGREGRGEAAGRFARALLVGIESYRRPEDCLEGCVNDVFLMSERLQQRGFAAENIRVLVNERATADAIRARLAWLLEGADDAQDRVFFYAGHGAQIPGYGRGEVVDRRDECLVPYDFDWNRPETAITDDWFHELYAQLPEGTRFLAVLDCCHSGGMARQGGLRARGLIPPDDIRHRLLRWDPAQGGFRERAVGDPRVRGERRQRKDLYGPRGDVHGFGRAVGLRLPPRRFAAARRAFGHGGPFLPVLIEACQEGELAHEIRLGSRSHGAFTWFLSETLRAWPASRPPTWEALVERVGRALAAHDYRQSPNLVCPTAMRTAPVPWRPVRVGTRR